jgi:XcyI restriction endonuclease
MKSKGIPINLPSSKPQANVASYLEEFRRVYLQQALSNAVETLDLPVLNKELDELAPARDLQRLAGRGIRGELIFCLPAILAAKPNLLGYYRLLLGYSQKEFYQKSKLGRFEVLEAKGELPERLKGQVRPLCIALVQRASEMLNEIGFEKLTKDLLDDLSLLTLGPQLRGSLNTRIGKMANRAVFEVIQRIVSHAITSANESRLELCNASKRKVIITFSSDPDISVYEEISSKTLKNVVAIEIKGGTDKSNIWNRLGEAEKSHQSAKKAGFVEFWTIYNVLNLDLVIAREKSPTTNRFYSLINISSPITEEFADFRDRLVSLVGITAHTS